MRVAILVFSIGFCVLSSSDLMQRFGSLPIRARTTRFPERPKKSFVDSFKDSELRQGLSSVSSFGVFGCWEHHPGFLDSVSQNFGFGFSVWLVGEDVVLVCLPVRRNFWGFPQEFSTAKRV